MKKVLSALAIASIASMSAQVQAATVGSGFTVNVNLTAACLVNTAAAALDFGTYTGFGSSSVAAPTTSVTFKCTRGTTISAVTFDTTNGTAAGAGIVAGLQYTMATSVVSTAAGTAPVAGGAAGTADVATYTVTGTMPAGQAGGSAIGAQTSARTMTITY